MTGFPDRIEMIRDVILSGKQLSLYRAVCGEVTGQIPPTTLVNLWGFLQNSNAVLRLRQLMNHPNLLNEEGDSAKYKEIESDDLPEENLYQMLAYCVSLGLPSGLLIYAGNRFSRSLLVNRANIRLEAAGIDLTAEPSAVLERTRILARQLLREAEAVSNLRRAAS